MNYQIGTYTRNDEKSFLLYFDPEEETCWFVQDSDELSPFTSDDYHATSKDDARAYLKKRTHELFPVYVYGIDVYNDETGDSVDLVHPMFYSQEAAARYALSLAPEKGYGIFIIAGETEDEKGNVTGTPHLWPLGDFIEPEYLFSEARAIIDDRFKEPITVAEFSVDELWDRGHLGSIIVSDIDGYDNARKLFELVAYQETPASPVTFRLYEKYAGLRNEWNFSGNSIA